MADDGEKTYDINGIPEGYKVWLLPHTEEDEDGFETHYGNVIVKGDKVVVCDECPCESFCWFLFSSECEVEITDNESGQSREVTWTEPYFEGVFCGPTPEVAEEWHFVDFALCHYYAKGPKCRITSNTCDEEIPPEIEPPTFTECCNFAPLNTGCTELPFEWETKYERYRTKDEDGDVVYRYRYRSYKVYSDYTTDNPLWIGGWSAGDCEWVEWKIEIADVVGDLYARYIFPDDTYIDELLGGSNWSLPNEDGTCPVSAVIWMCPHWEVQLFLVTDFAASYNRSWYDADSQVRPNAFACVNGLTMSEPCNYYCHLQFEATCTTMEDLDCPCIDDLVITSMDMDIWRKPFPYNGPESQWYSPYTTNEARNSGWLIEDEDHPDSYWRAVRQDKCDKNGTWIKLLCASSNFEEWLASNSSTEITCDDWETPKKCPSQSCTENPEAPDPECPPEPPLGCYDDIEGGVLASGKVNGAISSALCVDLSAGLGEGMGCPGQPWRLKEIGGEQPGFVADFEDCACKDENDEIIACEGQGDTGCGTEYLSGEVNKKGELEGLPSEYCFRECGYPYWGYMELQLASFDCENGYWVWPNCD